MRKLDKASAIVRDCGLEVTRIHTHIGSGSDPEVWQRVSGVSLDIVKQFPSVTHLNLGGGYKVRACVSLLSSVCTHRACAWTDPRALCDT